MRRSRSKGTFIVVVKGRGHSFHAVLPIKTVLAFDAHQPPACRGDRIAARGPKANGRVEDGVGRDGRTDGRAHGVREVIK